MHQQRGGGAGGHQADADADDALRPQLHDPALGEQGPGDQPGNGGAEGQAVLRRAEAQQSDIDSRGTGHHREHRPVGTGQGHGQGATGGLLEQV
ncbi:hypothetical protein D3C77_689380 [compost metagenome]